jgi:hypothetical protein
MDMLRTIGRFAASLAWIAPEAAAWLLPGLAAPAAASVAVGALWCGRHAARRDRKFLVRALADAVRTLKAERHGALTIRLA